MDGGLGQMSFVVGRANFFDFGFRPNRFGRAMRLDRWRGL